MFEEGDVGQRCLKCAEKCPGFKPHVWRNVCEVCHCPGTQHELLLEDNTNVFQNLKITNLDRVQDYESRLELANELGYAWVPINVEPEAIEQFLTSLEDGDLPSLGSDGDRTRCRRLRLQLPVQDSAPRHLRTEDERRRWGKFINERNVEHLGIALGQVFDNGDEAKACHDCQKAMVRGEFCVRTKHSESLVWHPKCFRCSECKDLLVDFIYCWYMDRPYCLRHYGQMLKPRCKSCDELIFTEDFVRAMETEHHANHFACKQCDKSLSGHRYILKEDQPYCLQCYEQVFANVCEECQESIGCDSKDLSYKERHWHEKCFKCSDCSNSLVDRPFATKENSLFCAECYDNKFAARCDGCSNVFRAGMRKYEYRGKQWHEECFCCMECQQPIGAKSFIPREQQVVCVPCYEEKYAQRCTKCKQVIRRGGVTYKGEPWHKECFTCTHCDKQLAGVKFTSKDDQPYCADCYGELFAKKCCRCNAAITGFGGCKFISFEDRHWHSDCFQCYKCSSNLVGRGFLTDGDDILCPDCGR